MPRDHATHPASINDYPAPYLGTASYLVVTHSASAIGSWAAPAVPFLSQCTDSVSLFARAPPPASGEHDPWPLGRMVHTRQGDWACTAPAWLHVATRRDRRRQSTSSSSRARRHRARSCN